MEVLKKTIGKNAESAVRDYLISNGLHLLQENYSCKLGEIDLIMRDDSDEDPEIVFVEVRLRDSRNYGTAIDSVDIYKQRKIIRTATLYLQKTNLLDEVNCRFDVVGVQHSQSKYVFEWIKDAFSIDEFFY